MLVVSRFGQARIVPTDSWSQFVLSVYSLAQGGEVTNVFFQIVLLFYLFLQVGTLPTVFCIVRAVGLHGSYRTGFFC